MIRSTLLRLGAPMPNRDELKSAAVFGYSLLAFLVSMVVCYFVPVLFARSNPELYNQENPSAVIITLWVLTFGILISGWFISLYIAAKVEVLVKKKITTAMTLPGVILAVIGGISAFIAIAFAVIAALFVYYAVIVFMIFFVAVGLTGAASGRK